MPPRRFSRHTFTEGVRLDDLGEEELFLTEREPFLFRELPDNRQHIVREGGDRLWTLAHTAFQGLPRPAGLFWVIADFQPQPIHDPTLLLIGGNVLVIPSTRTVEEEIFSELRRVTG